MMKKRICIILSAVLFLGMLPSVFSHDTEKKSKFPSEWAQTSINKAVILGIIPNGFPAQWTDAITREQFCVLAFELLNQTTGISDAADTAQIADTDNPSVKALYRLGIVEGKTTQPEADGSISNQITFCPEDPLTREEAALILYRICKYAQIKDVYEDYRLSSYAFADEDEIADRAREAVYNIQLLGIMQGTGGDKFSPKLHYTTEQAVTTLMRLYDKLLTNDAAATFADRINAQMPTDQNYMFSPLSIKMVMAMAANGAGEETREEILNAIGAASDISVLNQTFKEMIEKYTKTDLIHLNLANSIWINRSNTAQSFSNTYKNKIEEFYKGDANIVTNASAVKTINNWVNEKTHEKIPSIIDDSEFRAMLINAVYFKAAWMNEFHESATKEDIFTDGNGKETKIDFMNQSGWMNYCDADGIRIVELPYLNIDENLDNKTVYDDLQLSMFVILSDEMADYETVLKENLSSKNLKRTHIRLSLPKFDFEYETPLDTILKTLGINKAFSSDAQFEDMFDKGNMQISRTVHKSRITVDEKGTEAAAVTAVSLGGAALPTEIIEFKADRPFTFVIRDNINGEILFMGRYAYPKAS